MLQAVLIGHLGADVQVNDVNGNKFASMRVASSESYKDGEGNKVEKTTWVDVTLNKYEGIAPYLKKGTQVYVRGFLSTRVYDSKVDHCKKAGITISATELQLLSSQRESTNTSNEQAEIKDAPF